MEKNRVSRSCPPERKRATEITVGVDNIYDAHIQSSSSSFLSPTFQCDDILSYSEMLLYPYGLDPTARVFMLSQTQREYISLPHITNLAGLVTFDTAPLSYYYYFVYSSKFKSNAIRVASGSLTGSQQVDVAATESRK